MSWKSPVHAGSSLAVGRRGNLMFMALFAILILGILTVAYHQWSRHGQAMAFRFEQSEVVRQVAEAAATEALQRLDAESVSPDSATGRWFMAPGAGPVPVPVPLTLAETGSMIRGDSVPKVVVEARHVDFRGQDSFGRKYYGQEGVGTVEIKVDATLELRNRPGVSTARCTLIRHHDFKIAAIVSRRDNAQQRTSYSQSFILDYALFLRQGLKEFIEREGDNLNQERVRLVIDQDQIPLNRRGRIFMGGTGDPWQGSNYVFLNVDEKNKEIIPKFPRQRIKQIGYDELRELFPKFKQYENPGTRPYLEKLKAYFEAQVEPVIKTTFEPDVQKCEESTRAFLNSKALPIERNRFPGFDLISKDPAAAANPANAEAILEGAIRQRFVYFVHFHLDTSDLPQVAQNALDSSPDGQKLKEPLPCTAMPIPAPTDQDLTDFLTNLAKLDAQQPKGAPRLLSKYDLRFLYKGGQEFTFDDPSPETFVRPGFYNSAGEPIRDYESGPKGLRVFSHINLWTRRLGIQEDLEALGILDRKRGILNLRGIITVDGEVELGTDGPLTVVGQGVLMAGGFRIVNGIAKKSANDLAVLYTRDGNIEVQTAQPVEAALIAMGNPTQGGEVIARSPLKVRGALAAERLSPGAWDGGEHVVAYDPVLKNPQDLYQITVSRGITFQRLSEGE